MDLNKLFKLQKELDDYIIKNKGLEEQDFLDEKILALQVELGELANELPEEFKFWANKKNNYEKALKEYVDGLHFVLSIGNHLELNEYEAGSIITYDTVLETFKGLYRNINDFEQEINFGNSYDSVDHFMFVIDDFVGLGELLGLTWQQIEEAYLEKHRINYERQEAGY